MLQERSHKRHVAQARALRKGPTGKIKARSSDEGTLVRIRAGKTVKQRRSNSRVRLRKEFL
jgi:hypothetical protein